MFQRIKFGCVPLLVFAITTLGFFSTYHPYQEKSAYKLPSFAGDFQTLQCSLLEETEEEENEEVANDKEIKSDLFSFILVRIFSVDGTDLQASSSPSLLHFTLPRGFLSFIPARAPPFYV